MSPTSYQLLHPAAFYKQRQLPFICGQYEILMVPETGIEPVRSVKIAGF